MALLGIVEGRRGFDLGNDLIAVRQRNRQVLTALEATGLRSIEDPLQFGVDPRDEGQIHDGSIENHMKVDDG